MPETAYIIVPEDRNNSASNILLLQNLTIDRENINIMDTEGVLQYNLSVSDVSGNLAYRVVLHCFYLKYYTGWTVLSLTWYFVSFLEIVLVSRLENKNKKQV